MSIFRGVSGVNREIKQQFRGVGGANREIKEQYRGVGGVNRKVFSRPPTYLYNAGDEFTTITGGWKVGYSRTASGNALKYATYMQCYTQVNTAPRRSYQTTNKIDLTSFTKLNVDIEMIGGKTTIVCGFLTDMSDYANAPIYYEAPSSGRRIATIDISGNSGSFYIAVFSSAGSETNTTNVYKVWLE